MGAAPKSDAAGVHERDLALVAAIAPEGDG